MPKSTTEVVATTSTISNNSTSTTVTHAATRTTVVSSNSLNKTVESMLGSMASDVTSLLKAANQGNIEMNVTRAKRVQNNRDKVVVAAGLFDDDIPLASTPPVPASVAAIGKIIPKPIDISVTSANPIIVETAAMPSSSQITVIPASSLTPTPSIKSSSTKSAPPATPPRRSARQSSSIPREESPASDDFTLTPRRRSVRVIQAEKDAEKAAKLAEKEAEKAAKLAEKEAEKAAKLAEKEAEKAAKLAEKEAALEAEESKKSRTKSPSRSRSSSAPRRSSRRATSPKKESPEPRRSSRSRSTSRTRSASRATPAKASESPKKSKAAKAESPIAVPKVASRRSISRARGAAVKAPAPMSDDEEEEQVRVPVSRRSISRSPARATAATAKPVPASPSRSSSRKSTKAAAGEEANKDLSRKVKEQLLANPTKSRTRGRSTVRDEEVPISKAIASRPRTPAKRLIVRKSNSTKFARPEQDSEVQIPTMSVEKSNARSRQAPADEAPLPTRSAPISRRISAVYDANTAAHETKPVSSKQQPEVSSTPHFFYDNYYKNNHDNIANPRIARRTRDEMEGQVPHTSTSSDVKRRRRSLSTSPVEVEKSTRFSLLAKSAAVTAPLFIAASVATTYHVFGHFPSVEELASLALVVKEQGLSALGNLASQF